MKSYYLNYNYDKERLEIFCNNKIVEFKDVTSTTDDIDLWLLKFRVNMKDNEWLSHSSEIHWGFVKEFQASPVADYNYAVIRDENGEFNSEMIINTKALKKKGKKYYRETEKGYLVFTKESFWVYEGSVPKNDKNFIEACKK